MFYCESLLESFWSDVGWKITFYSRRRCPRKWRWLIRPLLFAYMDMCVGAAVAAEGRFKSLNQLRLRLDS